MTKNKNKTKKTGTNFYLTTDSVNQTKSTKSDTV